MGDCIQVGEVETGQVKTDCPNMDFTLPGVRWEIAYRSKHLHGFFLEDGPKSLDEVELSPAALAVNGTGLGVALGCAALTQTWFKQLFLSAHMVLGD
jgi:hypothetical protein